MDELVVLVNNDGTPIGTAKKAEVHTANTPLHLAFSAYLFDERGQFLLTQRALSKKVWPGVWTNSVCGHLSPGKTSEEAIIRRCKFELGLTKISSPKVILPDYRYKTPPFDGIVENEICPVYAARIESDLNANPAEVEDYRWLTWPKVLEQVQNEPEIYSWWFKDQIKLLEKSLVFKNFLNN